MEYKYSEKNNYENFASGHVIYGHPGASNYPVRLASEIFARCLKHLGKTECLTIYDPCCGGGYLLTVLGFLHYNNITRITASDIDPLIVGKAAKNLSLLTKEGLALRKNQIEKLLRIYKKPSHVSTLDDLAQFNSILNKNPHTIDSLCIVADILDQNSLSGCDCSPDIVITDVPYGQMANWSDTDGNPVDRMLDTLLAVINPNTVLAVSMDKSQKISNDKFLRLEKIKIGKRRIEIIRLKEALK